MMLNQKSMERSSDVPCLVTNTLSCVHRNKNERVSDKHVIQMYVATLRGIEKGKFLWTCMSLCMV